MREHSIAELGITRDEDGQMQPGFQVGKGVALLDWQHRKEQAEFRKLCKKLYARNYQRRLDPAIKRARLKQWRTEHHEVWRKSENERRRKLARKRPPCTCEECGAKWVPCDGRRSGRFCGKQCRNRWHGREAWRRERKGLRQMNLRNDIKNLLREEPWLPVPIIKGRLVELGVKVGSVPQTLIVMHRAGELQRRKGHGRSYEYALP